MKKGLFSKMVATFTLIISISFIIIATFLSYWFEGYYFQQRKAQINSESGIIGKAAVEYLEGDISSYRLREILTYIGNYLATDIWLLDNYGYVYSVSNDKQKKLIEKQVFTNELEELRKGNSVEKRGAYGNIFVVPVHTYGMPIFYNGTFKGAIVMHTSINEIRGPLKKVYEIIWASAVLAIIASCFVIYYFSQRIIIRPLAQINYVADKISKGEVDKRVNINSKDEIGALAESFNSMADSLEKIENNRREFISNVSHEIRSPITSIKGFVSGMLDGIIPKEKERYYLGIVYKEIQRLTRLVNDLLDLSAIEAGEFNLRIEELELNEFIRLSVIKFETKIKDKKINVNVCLDDEDLFVAADRDRLVQIITNLLDNAIKYVNEGGNVKINTTKRGKKAYVSIFNDGPCISEQDLKKIWQRFYKEDKARSSKVSTGLGLPIVRSILTKLGEDIWVENVKNKGVKFTFTLTLI
ncbi:sensor histidine kinase [Clostridium acetireducens]|uniref:sensor histidine kinase n=1 Tax=Clostridium acetireducens TaxID=76489 RepID=UPI000872FE2A|nr:HAMP domain-containing sensor histidine kinase [Clostridium acetireducens]